MGVVKPSVNFLRLLCKTRPAVQDPLLKADLAMCVQ